MSAERDELAELLHDNVTDVLPSHPYRAEIRDQVNLAVQHLLAAGYRRPRTVTTYEELDALPDDSLVLASGKYLNGLGDFTDCWMRPIPDHVTGGTGARLWEVLIYLDGGVHNMTRNDCIALPATVLHEPEATK